LQGWKLAAWARAGAGKPAAVAAHNAATQNEIDICRKINVTTAPRYADHAPGPALPTICI
jgi:hypothetical protein